MYNYKSLHFIIKKILMVVERLCYRDPTCDGQPSKAPRCLGQEEVPAAHISLLQSGIQGFQQTPEDATIPGRNLKK